jgi:hypothetical protein
MIETSSGNVDLVGPSVGLIRQRRPTLIAKRPPGAGVGLIPSRRSLYELELRTFNYDPGDRLSSGGSPAVGTMTICYNARLGRRAEAHFATITATCNLILFHAGQ